MRKQIIIAILFIAILLIVILLFAVLLIALSSNSHKMRRVGEFVYDEDFTVTYESTLNAMFGDAWTVISVEEQFDEGEEPCGCGIAGINPHTYLLTSIEFLNGNGDVQTFQIDNRGDLSRQIERYITSTWIASYYRENFIDVYFQDVPLGNGTYVFGFLDRTIISPHLTESHELYNAAQEYSKQLSTPEGAPRLFEMTPANVFEKFPMYLAVSIRLDGETAHSPEVEEDIFSQVDNMIDGMIAYTNNSLNANFIISYQDHVSFHGERPRPYWNVMHGERINSADDN
jgi:hypothetical protein